MYANTRKNNLGAVDWGSLATNLVTTAASYRLNTLQEKRIEANRRAAAADAAAARAQEQNMVFAAPVTRRAVSVANSVTSSPVVMLGAAGALGLALFLMKRKK